MNRTAARVIDWLANLPVPAPQAVGLAAGVLLDRIKPLHLPGPQLAYVLGGWALLLGGVSVNQWALRVRRQVASGDFDLERPDALVTTGPYRLSRHPMYVGWWLMHLGVGLARRSAWVVITLPAAALADHHGVLQEERLLATVFAGDYQRYATVVPRYFAPARNRVARTVEK